MFNTQAPAPGHSHARATPTGCASKHRALAAFAGMLGACTCATSVGVPVGRGAAPARLRSGRRAGAS
eukprot:214098-Alexandrium_andersonii.AAC.1